VIPTSTGRRFARKRSSRRVSSPLNSSTSNIRLPDDLKQAESRRRQVSASSTSPASMLRAAAAARFPTRVAGKRPRAVMAPARVAMAGAEARSPLLRGRRSSVPEMRASFCAKATGAGGSEAASSTEEGAEAAGGEAGEGEKGSSAIAAPLRPEDCHTVRAFLLPR
jgi:hypothetical protein